MVQVRLTQVGVMHHGMVHHGMVQFCAPEVRVMQVGPVQFRAPQVSVAGLHAGQSLAMEIGHPGGLLGNGSGRGITSRHCWHLSYEQTHDQREKRCEQCCAFHHRGLLARCWPLRLCTPTRGRTSGSQ